MAALLVLSGIPAPAASSGIAISSAQRPSSPDESLARAVPAADSAELLADARDAQRRFEYVRRRHLPVAFSRGGGDCDDVVGRMCWTHATGSLWSPDPEDPRVGEARGRLLDALATVGEALPGDHWVLGQRVWYLLEAERAYEALRLARACGGGAGGPTLGWWCAALEGLVLHVEGRYREAGAAFDRALAAMEPERAREWEDVRHLLDGDARDVVADASERSWDEGRGLVDRMWRMADPFLVVPGNERRTEHLARRTVSRIRSEARNPHDLSWGDDLEELLIRYGWGVGWERVPPTPGSIGGRGSVIGHEHPESRSFVPSGAVLSDAGHAEAEAWIPGLAYAPSAYAPAYAPVVLPMASRVVVLHRGDRALVAAPYALPPDTTRRTREGVRIEHRPPSGFDGGEVVAGLFLAPVAGGEIRGVTEPGRARGVLVTEAPTGAYWTSIEVVDVAAGRAGRIRHGLEVPRLPPDLARVSDLLILEGGPLPGTAEDALERLRFDDGLTSGGTVVVAWEVWGLGWREEILGYRLSLVSAEGGFFHRVGRALGLVDPEKPSTLEWEEPGPERPGPHFRSVEMALPEVEPGEYSLRLEITTPGRTPLVSERRVRLTGG